MINGQSQQVFNFFGLGQRDYSETSNGDSFVETTRQNDEHCHHQTGKIDRRKRCPFKRK